jgi:hypothetical protein
VKRSRKQRAAPGPKRASPLRDELPTTYAPRSSDDFELVTNVDSLRQSAGTISGYVAFRLRDQVFPGAFWNDLIVKLISWWAGGVADLLGKTRTKQWPFMDGPYELRVVKDDIGSPIWSLQGYDRGRACTEALHVDRTVVVHEFIERGQELLRACSRHGWATTDTANLQSAIDRLIRERRLL